MQPRITYHRIHETTRGRRRVQLGGERERPHPHFRRRIAFVACVFVVAIVWLGVLPWLSRRGWPPGQTNDQIDPIATFYTEIDALPAIRERLSIARHQHPEAFGAWTDRKQKEDGDEK